MILIIILLSFATTTLRSGVEIKDISKVLGHSKIETTENYYITTDFKNDEEFQKFINTISSRSKLKFDATVDVNDTILTLSTCYKTDEKVVLHAKLIKKEVRN